MSLRSWAQVRASGEITNHEMERFGIDREELDVVRFLDARTDQPWWAREHEIVGRISTLCADGVPCDKVELFAFVHTNFGSDCGVVW